MNKIIVAAIIFIFGIFLGPFFFLFLVASLVLFIWGLLDIKKQRNQLSSQARAGSDSNPEYVNSSKDERFIYKAVKHGGSLDYLLKAFAICLPGINMLAVPYYMVTGIPQIKSWEGEKESIENSVVLFILANVCGIIPWIVLALIRTSAGLSVVPLSIIIGMIPAYIFLHKANTVTVKISRYS